MMKKNYLLAVVIGGAFIALMGVFTLGLSNNPQQLSLATQGQKVPAFSLPTLTTERPITHVDLTTDNTFYLINVWATWCPECHKEHAFLQQLSTTVTVYGLNWKDDRQAAKQFINKLGNPFSTIIVDDSSTLAIGLGVYGAPETFLIAADGTILYRHTGVLNATVWQRDFVPTIQSLTAGYKP